MPFSGTVFTSINYNSCKFALNTLEKNRFEWTYQFKIDFTKNYKKVWINLTDLK